MASAYAAGPIGYLAAGFAIERFGAEATFVTLGVLMLAVSVIAVLFPVLRLFDEPGEYQEAVDGG
jgi:hypothetical protein